jgi:transitional endoplasmic reticulum ATPase
MSTMKELHEAEIDAAIEAFNKDRAEGEELEIDYTLLWYEGHEGERLQGILLEVEFPDGDIVEYRGIYVSSYVGVILNKLNDPRFVKLSKESQAAASDALAGHGDIYGAVDFSGRSVYIPWDMTRESWSNFYYYTVEEADEEYKRLGMEYNKNLLKEEQPGKAFEFKKFSIDLGVSTLSFDNGKITFSDSSTENTPVPTLSESLNNALQKTVLDKNGNAKTVAIQHTADIVRHGEAITVPEAIPLDAAIQILRKRMEYEEQIVRVSEVIDVFPWDGAVALQRVMKERFGHGMATETEGFWGPIPPAEISIEVGFEETVLVPWGKFILPDGENKADSFITTENPFIDGRVSFALGGQVRRKFAPLVAELAKRVREIVRTDSIYKGKALRMRFKDDDGDTLPVPMPKFWDLSRSSAEPIFSDIIHRMVQTNIVTPIIHREAVAAAGVPFKRGVLLAGPYGTGKTMIASMIAKKAPAHNITFIYLDDVRELAEGLRFAKMYQPAVIFAEDVDRATSGPNRTIEIDRILNTIDGIDSKDSEIMVITTTNHVDEINQAMLRPGRFDVILSVEPPDAKAAEKLIRAYAGTLLNANEDLTAVGAAIEGQIPAVIREVVERSKLEVITRTGAPAAIGSIQTDDLLAAVATMDNQRKLLTPKPVDNRSPVEKAADTLAAGFTNSTRARVVETMEAEVRGRVASTKGLNHGVTPIPMDHLLNR